MGLHIRHMFKRVLRARLYHLTLHPASNVIVDAKLPENRLLAKALDHVPAYGFDERCIAQAVKDLGYSDAFQSVVSSQGAPAHQLVMFWLRHNRQRLYNHVLDPALPFHTQNSEYDRVAYLVKQRLRYNEPVLGKLPGALAQLTVPYNWAASLEELHNLSDDVAFYAGDMLNDSAWYAKRFLFSSLYVKSELYMLQDTSENYRHTMDYVERSVRSVEKMGDSYNAVEQWLVFNAILLVNLIKLQLARG